MAQREVAVVDGAGQDDELGIPGEPVTVFLAGIQIHVGAGAQPTGVRALAGEESRTREQGVGAIEFPAVDAPVEDLLLQSVPPLESLGVRVVDEGPGPLPPTDLAPSTGEESPVSGVLREIGGITDGRIAVPRIDHGGHPEDHAIAVGLELTEETGRVGITTGVDAEVVVALAPRAIEKEGPDRKVMGRVACEKFPDRLGRVGIVFPEPALQGPCGRQRHPAMALRLEGKPPERMGPQQEEAHHTRSPDHRQDPEPPATP